MKVDLDVENDYIVFTFSPDENWNSDSLKIIAIVQNYNTRQIYQVTQININDMNPDIDQDGILNSVDNCIELWNPGQEDLDNDLIGDICDPCNNLIYISGNVNGDVDMTSGLPIIDLMDVLSLADYLTSNQAAACQEPTLNINNDGYVNVVDVIVLIQSILNGTN